MQVLLESERALDEHVVVGSSQAEGRPDGRIARKRAVERPLIIQ